MSLWDRLTGKSSGGQERPPLTHIRDLQIGDILELGYVAPAGLSNERLRVTEIETYEYAEGLLTTFEVVNAAGDHFTVASASDEGRDVMAVSRTLPRKEVETLLDMEAFGQIFAEGAGTPVKVLAHPPHYEGWLPDTYVEEVDAVVGYYHAGDYRKRQLPENGGEKFDGYELKSPDENFGLEVEVYLDGETEVSIVVFIPASHIEGLWAS
ncbi:MAG: hypothetical protein ACPG06_04665 [Alphaproteobacteria bacterium]